VNRTALSLPFSRAGHISARLPKQLSTAPRRARRASGRRARLGRAGTSTGRALGDTARDSERTRPRADRIWPPQWRREMVLLEVLFLVSVVASCARREGARSALVVARRVAYPPRAARRDIERSLGGVQRCAQHARTGATRPCGPRWPRWSLSMRIHSLQPRPPPITASAIAPRARRAVHAVYAVRGRHRGKCETLQSRSPAEYCVVRPYS
jgi:hypothetical protein